MALPTAQRRSGEEKLRIAVIGGGPGGLYFAYLWKRRHPDARIDLFEQNSAGATWGFGVVFSEQALEFLRADDPDTVDVIAPRMEGWNNITLNLRGVSVEIDSVGFHRSGGSSCTILQDRVRSVGVAPRYDTLIASVDQLTDYDLIVGADGLNSRWSGAASKAISAPRCPTPPTSSPGTEPQKGSRRCREFIETELGSFNAHHYRYSPGRHVPGRMRFADTWQRYGFADKSVEESKSICERVFAATLDGHSLVSNKSVWRNFPWIWNERWSFKNMVLIGDALHSAHFSIGSGTRLAIEDAIALTKALEAERDIPAALARYQAERKPVVKKLVTAARTSADWYEKFPEHEARPDGFAYGYITFGADRQCARARCRRRSWRNTRCRDKPCGKVGLGMTSPKVAGVLELADAVPPDSPGALEIGFTMPAIQCQPHPVRQSFPGPATGLLTGPAGAQLCGTRRRSLAVGIWPAVAGTEARRPRADVPDDTPPIRRRSLARFAQDWFRF
jgi:2-polyprenyl-6-methoxyphenol hydroxylase-like FAD-dependent oxidoreductase